MCVYLYIYIYIYALVYAIDIHSVPKEKCLYGHFSYKELSDQEESKF